MLQTAARNSFQKIITSTLASALLIFPVLVRSNPVVAQNEIWFLSELPKEHLEQNTTEIEENLLLSNFYIAKYAQTNEIGYLDQAIERVQQVIRLQPAFVPARMMLYLFLMEKAVVQTDETLISQLKPHYQALMDSSLEPEQLKNIPPPIYVAGLVYYNISSMQKEAAAELRYEQKAIDAIKKAIKINPDYYGSHLMLGRIYYYQDKNDLAFSEVQKAIRLNRNDPNNYQLLGDIHADNIHRAKDCWDNRAITEGIRAYKQAIRLEPNHVGAHLGLSRMYIHQKVYNLAIMESKIAVELSDSMYSHYQLGEALLHTEDYEQAIQEYKKAIKQDQDNSYAILYAEIALAHFLQGNYEDAAQEYQKYMALEDAANKPYVVIHYHLVLNRLGRHREAQKLLKEYLSNFEGEKWELALLQFNSDELSEQKLMSKVSNKCQRCEALFFAGYQYLLSGEREKAQKYFQSALDTKAYCNTEYLLARAVLNQLKLK